MTYNCRLIQYPTGHHVTFYKKAIETDKETNENFNKAYQKENREKQEETHCKSVSLKHTKNRIYQIARSNTWKWFVTLTFDRGKTDASDYMEVVKKFTKYFNNIQQRKCPNLKYLIVPELHKDRAHYHFHGLLANCEGLHFKYSGHNDRKSGKPVFNILDWTLGFTTATRVEDSGRVSSYITKYITKDVMLFLKNKKRYYCSRNVDIAEPEYFVMDEEDFQTVYKDKISYCKTITVQEAYQQISYYEIND